MAKEHQGIRELTDQVKELKLQLSEAQETLQAIQTGVVDALVVQGPSGDQIYTLKDAEHPYRVIVESINEGAATLASDGTIFYCNNQLADLLKVPLNKVMGLPITNFVVPAYLAKLESVFQRAYLNNSRAEIELKISGGATIPVLVSARALSEDKSHMISMLITDLSEHRHTEQIIASERFAQTLMEQAATVVVTCDSQGTIIRASEKARILFRRDMEGWKFDQIFNQLYPSLIDSYSSSLFDSYSSSLSIPDKPICFSDICQGGVPSGSEITLKINGQPDQNYLINVSRLSEDQNILGYSIALTDITELKKVEKIKDEFIGMVSHELKTPLTVIIGALATAIDKRVSVERARELLSDAVFHAEILANVVDNLLELSRQQSDRLFLQIQSIDIGEIIQRVITRLEEKSESHRFLENIQPDLPPVLADSLRVWEILNNLMGNAIKYSPRDSEIKLSARLDGDHLLVGIKDEGPGISHDDQARLFQSFERMGKRVPGSIQGVGLGLKVCSILVEAQHGKIWVESAEGQGSTFFFTLPVAKELAIH